MNIDDMSEQEKSNKLCELAGFRLPVTSSATYPTPWENTRIAFEVRPTHPNLYDPVNMALAWRVLNWTGDNFTDNDIYELSKFMLGSEDLEKFTKYVWYTDNAQTAWLDKILQLAVDAGMLTAT